MKKFTLTQVFIITMTISAVSLALMSLKGCQTINAKEMAKQNRCPYEGAECPNAQALMGTIDSLTNIVTEMQFRRATSKVLHKINVNEAGISVIFTIGDTSYAYDYMTPRDFEDEFGFKIVRESN